MKTKFEIKQQLVSEYYFIVELFLAPNILHSELHEYHSEFVAISTRCRLGLALTR